MTMRAATSGFQPEPAIDPDDRVKRAGMILPRLWRMRISRRFGRLAVGSLAVASGLIAWSRFESPVAAAEEPTFAIEFNDGTLTPTHLDVPANTRFKIDLTNKGKTPAEFESSELRLEKVLAAGSKSTLVIRTLDPGEYKFFDDFHPDAPQAVLVAK